MLLDHTLHPDPDLHGSILKLLAGSGSVVKMQVRIQGIKFNKKVGNNGCKIYKVDLIIIKGIYC